MIKELTPDQVLGQNEQFLIYGLPKTGKTFLALTAPDPIYYLVVGPMNELKTRYSKAFMERFPNKRVFADFALEEYGEHGEITDNPIGLDQVGEKLDAFLEAQKKGEMPQCKTIVVDNATVLEEYMMYKAMIAGYELAGNKEKTALKRLREYGIIKPGDLDWGAAQSLMDKFVNWLLKLPYHVVFIAHEYQEFSRDSENTRAQKLIGIYPLFIGKQRTLITRAFDNVWRMSRSGGGRSQQFMCQTVGSDIIVAGTRVGGILDDIEPVNKDFSLEEVIKKFAEYPRTISSDSNVAKSLKQVKGV